MKKIIMSLLSIFLLFMTSIHLVHAEPTSYIIDEFDVLEEEEEKTLNEQAQQIEKDYGIAIYFAYLQNEEISDLDVTTVVGDKKDYLLMAENEEIWIVRAGGIIEEMMTEIESEEFRDAYDQDESYVGGVKSYLESVKQWIQDEELIGSNQTISEEKDDTNQTVASDDQDTTNQNETPTTDDQETNAPVETDTEVVKTTAKLYDGADIFTTEQEQELLEKINTIVTTHNVDVAIASVETCGSKSIESYIGEYYDQNGFGIGENRDGVLFLISMGEREFRILSNGLGADAIKSGDIDAITDIITSDLTDGKYASALTSFLEECEYRINGTINGYPFPFVMNGLISIIVGLAIALLTTNAMKNELKSVVKQKQAKDYMKKGSMQLIDSNEFFLYHTISREEKESSSSSSSSSSSGSSRNVGGGSF